MNKKGYEKYGNKLISLLGMENKTVIKYWKALEKRDFITCYFILKKYQKTLDKMS